jgi:16S rRNA (uracil1498-N3)-methyltransferase
MRPLPKTRQPSRPLVAGHESGVNLILLEPDEVDDRGEVTLGGARAAHLLAVLKVVPDGSVSIGLLDGPRGRATVLATEPGRVRLRTAFEQETPAVPPVDLLLAVPRPKVLRRLWAQLSALGVGRIILTNAARVERNYFDTHVLSPECYRPLLIDGLQQARDTRLPSVTIHRRLRPLVEDDLDALAGAAHRLVADHRAMTPVVDALAARNSERVLLAIGPEGGWNEFELRMLEDHGFHSVALGARTLRVDTACIALLALVHACRRR